MIPLVIGANNRPQYLSQTLESLDRYLPNEVDVSWIQNDTDHQGMAANVQAAWTRALILRDWDYLLWWEEDFILNKSFPLHPMIRLLQTRPRLAQLVLKRNPVNDQEIAAGNMLRAQDGYTQRPGYVEHTHIFSLNPCLIPRHVIEMGWPSGPLGVGNETGMTLKCLDAGLSFAFYGQIDDPPLVTHIGVSRGEHWSL